MSTQPPPPGTPSHQDGSAIWATPPAHSTPTVPSDAGYPPASAAPQAWGAPVPGQGPGVPGPTAPVPPRSRAGAHVIGLVLAVVCGTAAFALSAAALERASRLFDGSLLPTAALAAGAGVLLGLVAAWSARSSVGSAVTGAVWTVLGLLGTLGPYRIYPLLDALPPESRYAVTGVISGGLALAVGAVLVGVALASSTARRRGRGIERREQRLVAAGAVGVPPRPRILAHLLSVAVTAVAVVVVLVAAQRLLVHLQRLEPTSSMLLPIAVLILAGVVAAAVGGLSSLGPALVGGVLLVLSVVEMASPSSRVLSRFLSPLTDLVGTGQTAPWLLYQGGTVTLALVLLLGAVGTHLARRDGRRTQRQEQASTQAQARAWS